MAVNNFKTVTLWNNESTGAAGESRFVHVGVKTNVAVFVEVDGATTIGIEVAAGNGTAGSNAQPADTDAYKLFKNDGSGALTIVFSGAGTAALDLSPFAPQFLRLTSTNDVTATAQVNVVG